MPATLLAPLPESPPEPEGPWDSPGQSWKGLEGPPAPPLQLPEAQLPEEAQAQGARLLGAGPG